jgi:hypothetical protein
VGTGAESFNLRRLDIDTDFIGSHVRQSKLSKELNNALSVAVAQCTFVPSVRVRLPERVGYLPEFEQMMRCHAHVSSKLIFGVVGVTSRIYAMQEWKSVQGRDREKLITLDEV